MVGARPESTIAILEMVERKWGGAEGYVKKMAGTTGEEISKVRRALIVSSGPTSRKRAPTVWQEWQETKRLVDEKAKQGKEPFEWEGTAG
jgi:hypothetical protein